MEADPGSIDAYKPDKHDWRLSILNHPKGHSKLPPAYFQICGMDPLRDEGFIYERVLREDEGIKTKVDVYPGLPHGFWGFFTMLKAAKKYHEDILKGIGWLLNKTPDLDNADTEAKKGAGV